MAVVHFASALQSHCPAPPLTVEGMTVGAALSAAFLHYPKLKSYVLDDQGAVRKHVAIFLDGETIEDREHLTDRIVLRGEIFVMQALSGG